MNCTRILRSLFLTAAVTAAFTTANAAPESKEQTTSSTFPAMQEVTQDGLRPHIGITAGVANPEGSYSSGAEFGFNFGFQPYIPFGVGLAVTTSRNNAQSSGERDLERTTAMVRGTYNFGGNIAVIKHSYIGLATGPIFNQDAMYFAIAPVAGFDIPVREWEGTYLSYLSIGVDARYLIVSSNESDALTVNGAMKYWF